MPKSNPQSLANLLWAVAHKDWLHSAHLPLPRAARPHLSLEGRSDPRTRTTRGESGLRSSSSSSRHAFVGGMPNADTDGDQSKERVYARDIVHVYQGSAFHGGNPAIVSERLDPHDGRLRTAWLLSFLDSSRPRLPDFSPMELSSVLFCLSKMRLRPGKNWMDAAFAASAANMHRYPPLPLANTFLALHRMDLHQLPTVWKEAFFLHSARWMPVMSIGVLVRIAIGITGFVALVPPQQWQDAFTARAEAVGASLVQGDRRVLAHTLISLSQRNERARLRAGAAPAALRAARDLRLRRWKGDRERRVADVVAKQRTSGFRERQARWFPQMQLTQRDGQKRGREGVEE